MKALLIIRDYMKNSNFRIFGIILLLLFVVELLPLTSSFAQESKDEHPMDVKSEQIVQTKCPVLIDEEIGPNIYVDYEGKRVYFCCDTCKAAFIDEPQKYLIRLPQFAMADTVHDDHNLHSHHESGTTLFKMIVPMGISTLVLVAATVFLSVFRRLNVRLMMK